MQYHVRHDLQKMDFELIYQFIKESYWAKDIPKKRLLIALQNSLCFGVFEAEQQLGFARMVTDSATFAYLADVFVLPEHRGKGLADILMADIMSHPDLQGLRKMMLTTRDAHGLYAKYGFQAIDEPERLMHIVKTNCYTT